jgi:hypothetical protein
MIDPLQRAYYDAQYELNYRKSKGNTFQDFFSDIMERCHPNDYLRTRPWGNRGDSKNDGYLGSERTLFQVYAPSEMSEAKAVRKIHDDFHGCLPHWREFFDEWVFVHNSADGVGPGVTGKLLKLREDNRPLRVGHWGLNEIRKRVSKLDQEDLASLFGPAPTNQTMAQLGYADIKVVLDALVILSAPDEVDMNAVPSDKLQINDLSENTAILLGAGRRKSPVVEQFFQRWPDLTFGDRVAGTFQAEYLRLKQCAYPPVMIFQELMMFAGAKIPGYEAAGLAILAHLFDLCDIFERVPVSIGQ